jgi:hypothetical protein
MILPATITATRSASACASCHVVGGEDDRLAQRAERANGRPRAPAGARVEAGGGLVEEQHLGVADQAEREVEAPLLPARERAHARVALVGELDQLQQLVHGARALVPAAVHLEHLGHGELGLEPAGLQHDAEAVAQRALAAGGVGAEHAHRAGVGQAVALEDLDRRGLARAVGAEEAEHLAGGDVEADAADGLRAVVGLVEVSDGDRGHGRRR